MRREWFLPIVVAVAIFGSLSALMNGSDELLESLRKRAEALLPIPIQKPVDFPPLPPRVEDIRPCKVGFVISPEHGGKCVQAPPGFEPFSTANRSLVQTTVTTTDGREIPFREAYDIGVSHFDELKKIPGAGSFGFRLGINGIYVETDNPNDTSTWPKEVEGVPIVPVPRRIGQDVWTGGICLGSGEINAMARSFHK